MKVCQMCDKTFSTYFELWKNEVIKKGWFRKDEIKRTLKLRACSKCAKECGAFTYIWALNYEKLYINKKEAV